MHSILLIALLISTSTFAKVQTNWGKMYDITKDNTNTDIPLPTADVTTYLNTYFQQIILDIASNQSSSNIYTIVFPVRDYIVSNTVTFSLALQSSINNATIIFIGLKSSYVNGSFKNLSVVDQEAYINAHYASTNIICNNDPSSSNYLNYQSKDLMPKFIYTPPTPTNVNMFEFINSVNNITLANNTCNIMGLEIQGEAFNNWSNLQPHPYFNTTNCKGLIDLAFWANAYIDNNYLHDHYGRGISTQLDPSSLFYRNKDVVISNNVVENVYAFLPGTLVNGAIDNCGDGINLMGIHGAIIKNNYVFNDLNITGMCGRLGIGGDAFQYCTIEGNVVNGYNRDIHIESGSGNNIVAKNRLTGTYCAILSYCTVNPNPIIGNYIATKNIPNLTLNTWGGALGYTLDSALRWAYGFGLINYIPDNNLPLPIVGNILYIDVNAGGSPSSAPGSYFYIHSNKNNIDLNCNEFNSNTGSFGLFIGGALHSLQSNSFNNINQFTINWSALNTNNTFANSLTNCVTIYYNGIPSFSLSNPSTSNSCFQLFANTTYNCNAPTAQINFTAIGGVAPINYSINGSAQSSPFIAASGSYTIVATDANSNTTSTNITITLPTPLPLSIATTNVPCYNGNNGTAISTVTGSVSPYHYFWTDNIGNPISNQTIYDDAALHLSQGNYILTVTDAIGCTATNSFSISQPAIQNAAIVTTSNSNLCQGGTGGTATVAVVPSNNSYTYSWSTTPVQTTATATNLAAGTYTATVTNGGYCAQTTITFTGIATTTIRFDVSCTTASDGSIQLTATGGTPSYTYNWSNAATTQNLTNLAAGNYACTVTDANGCTTSQSITITQPTQLTISATSTNINCYGGTSTITTTTSGGTGTIITNAPSSAVSAGTYNIIATDANACTASTTITITEPTQLTISATSTNINCYGGTSTITTTTSGGTGTITTAPANTGLTAGTYTFTATDANGCLASSFVTIAPAPSSVTISATAGSILCNGGTANVTLITGGGTGIISTTPASTSLSAGTYVFSATDANGCTSTIQSTIVPAPSAVTISPTAGSILCNGGTADVILATGGGTGTITTAPGNTGLTAGTYTFTATDANGCLASSFVTIAPAPSSVTISATAGSILCNGGTANVTLITGGGTGIISTTPANTGLSAGTYVFIATDANGCNSTIQSAIAPAPSAVTIFASAGSILCNGGTANVTLTTGGGAGTITTAPTNTGLMAGNYTFTATDANGCSATTLSTIAPQPILLMASATTSDVSCATASDGSIQLNATGGTPGYTYNWSNGATNQNLSNLAAGNYACTITDANSCSTTVNNLTINAPSGAYCCNTSFTNAPTHILADNINSSALAQSTYSNTAIMVNGTFTIDNNLILNNCQVYFTANAKIDILNNYSLTLYGCTLQSGCGAYWDGIYADDITEQLNITNFTNISDMENGINISNNAKLICSNNTFLNNANYAVKLSNIIANTQVPIVNNNSFSSDANFILYNTATKGAGGIDMLDCSDMTINQNNFSNLYNGINITASNTITNSIASNTIDLINNHFQDITFSNSPYYYLPNNNIPMNAYNDTKGCAINIDYSLAPTFDATTNITIATLDTTVNTIFNTTKAIVNHNSNVNIQNQTIKNTTFGILSSCMLYKNQNIDNNFIDNTHLGIQTLGGIGVTSVQNNIVKNCIAILDDVGAGITNAPTGIDIKNLQYVLGGGINQQINSNRVEIASETGIGIAELNSQAGNITSNNDIRFNTINAGTVYCYTKDLVGVHLTNCEAIDINANWISGINATIYNAAFTARQSKGMYFQDSKHNIIGCNNIKNTKQGLYAWGDNTTADGNITFNHIKNTNSPVYTYDGPNTSSGNLGNIGSASVECANDWCYQGAGASLLYGGYKILRNTTSAVIPNNIYTKTSLLLPAESGKIPVGGIGQAYGVQPNTTFTLDPCLPTPGSFFVTQDPNNDNTSIDHDIAVDIANGDVDYLNHAIIGQWLNEKDLYNKLDRDINLRNSDPVLLSFYNTKHSQLIGKIKNADSAIASMLFNINNNNIGDMFDFANGLNSEIIDGSPWEQNERDINEIYLQIAEQGITQISEDNKSFVTSLSNTCPYVGGSAVYKARVLNALQQPNTQYNDRILCIPTAQNKMANGNSSIIQDIDSLNDAMAIAAFGKPIFNAEAETHIAKETIIDSANNNISIYPNPTSGQITIIYNCTSNGKFYLYNATGQQVLETELVKENKKAELNLNNLTNGVYHYKINFETCPTTVGKLTILK